MKTVGEFKKAGLVFVEGDDGVDFYVYNQVTMNADITHDDSEVESFSWRENTGAKPEFSGLIEFTFNGEGCEMQEARLAENVNWEIVKKWRPSLNKSQHSEWPDNSRIDSIGQNGNDGLHYDNTAQQVEALAVNAQRPIFTQVMADAGELPPVGCKVKVCIEGAGFELEGNDAKHEGKDVTVKSSFTNKDGDKIVAIENDYGNCACYIIECIKPLDTRTPKQKAVDAIFLWVNVDKLTLEVIYDLWRVGEKC